MKNLLLVLNVAVSIVIVILILVQGRGAGLGSAWGGGGEFYQTRRGVEQITLKVTAILIVVFLIISVINFFAK